MPVQKRRVDVGEATTLHEPLAHGFVVHLDRRRRTVGAGHFPLGIVVDEAVDGLAEDRLPRIAAHLTVGEDRHAGIALHGERIENRAILDLA